MHGMTRWMVPWLFAALVIAPIARAQDAAKPAPFRSEEIEQLIAPIALYPDALIAQILMASTYPLEIVTAARWSKANPKVTGKALEDAMQKQTWDPSVKSLAAFPGVLAMMNDKLDRTQKLGDAFLGQQKEVMDAVQRLRAKAYAAGNLKSGKEQKVTTEQQGTTTIIIIEPAQPEVVYVPTYNPMVVYGPWPYPAYPPYYYYPPGYVAGPVFVFTVGVIVGRAMWGGCNWHGNSVYINVNHYNSFNRTNINNGNWQHQPEHRKGVQYRDTASQQKYGGGQRQGAESRDAYRGRDGQGGPDSARGGADPLKGGGASDRAGGREAGAADRAGGVGAADRAGGAGDRAGGGAGDFGGTQRGGGREAGAFDGVGQGGQTRDFSSRGASSHAGGGGGARAGGGGGRGGGGRR
jgi:hypothetical protein